MVAELDLDTSDERQKPTLRLGNLILTESLQKGAQAIRLRSGNEWGEVDYQLGGAWRRVMRIPRAAFPHILAAMKTAGAVGADGRGTLDVRFQGAARRFELNAGNVGMIDEVLTLSLPDAGA